MGIFSLPTSETEIVHTIGKTHDELAILEFNPRHIALIAKLRLPCLDVGESNCFNSLPQCDVGAVGIISGSGCELPLKMGRCVGMV
jgi:hypothetical protein